MEELAETGNLVEASCCVPCCRFLDLNLAGIEDLSDFIPVSFCSLPLAVRGVLESDSIGRWAWDP